ncbi:MAG: hypothetical protein IT435_14545 [Phycisphaerales bacterium]|nr:hypothetical protein [Phycisphaerales bacterium]
MTTDPAASVTPGRASRILLFAASIASILTGITHTIAHLLDDNKALDATHGQMIELMQSYKIPVPGGHITAHQIMNGMGIHFAISMAAIGFICLGLRGPIRQSPILHRRLAALCALITTAFTVVALVYFFSIPIAFEGTTALLFILAALTSPKP